VSSNDTPEQALALKQWCAQGRSTEQVLRIHNSLAPLCLAHADSSVRLCLAAGWKGLLAFRPGLRLVHGDARILPLDQSALIKLQFFIDQAASVESVAPCKEPWAGLREPAGKLCSASSQESWYLSLALRGGVAYQAFAQQLRRSESYQLLGFLLGQGGGNERLLALAGRYGVSVSHFRRLCHQALGGAAKPKLREWRGARALLAMAEGDSSLTDLALEHGFASSSHFSREIRMLVGVAPSQLVDITRLSSE